MGDNMKIQTVGEDLYHIYVYSFSTNDSIVDTVKEIFQRLQKRYSWKGFYHVEVCQYPCGLFLTVSKIEDSFYKNTLDLKIETSSDIKVYFQSDDYFIVSDFPKVYYYGGVYYGLVDDSLKEILEKVEFGEFVWGLDVDDCIYKSILI